MSKQLIIKLPVEIWLWSFDTQQLPYDEFGWRGKVFIAEEKKGHRKWDERKVEKKLGNTLTGSNGWISEETKRKVGMHRPNTLTVTNPRSLIWLLFLRFILISWQDGDKCDIFEVPIDPTEQTSKGVRFTTRRSRDTFDLNPFSESSTHLFSPNER